MLNKIIKKEILGPGIKLFNVSHSDIAKKAKPGQFVIVRVSEEGERIPLTIADYEREKGTITFVVQEVGKTTFELGAFKVGDSILDIAGPLGNPSHIDCYGSVVCIGGGIGIAPIYPIARALKDKGNEILSIIGARSKELIFWEERMRVVSDELYVTTDDGSYGKKGFVTDKLKELIDRGKKIDKVMAIGPVVMMKAVAAGTKKLGIPTIVSLNPIMVDATGMCGGCRVEVGGKTKFACVDGPEFDAHEVDFDQLLRRQNMYKEEEERAKHKCKITNYKSQIPNNTQYQNHNDQNKRQW